MTNLTIEEPVKMIVRLYANDALVKETDDQRCWSAVLDWIIKHQSEYRDNEK